MPQRRDSALFRRCALRSPGSQILDQPLFVPSLAPSPSVVIFPKTPDHLKSMTGEEAYNPDGLAQRAIRSLKDAFPDLEVYTDVALDPYNVDGHDGIVRSDGVVLNDETVYRCALGEPAPLT